MSIEEMWFNVISFDFSFPFYPQTRCELHQQHLQQQQQHPHAQPQSYKYIYGNNHNHPHPNTINNHNNNINNHHHSNNQNTNLHHNRSRSVPEGLAHTGTATQHPANYGSQWNYCRSNSNYCRPVGRPVHVVEQITTSVWPKFKIIHFCINLSICLLEGLFA
jgi:hypothetical protein